MKGLILFLVSKVLVLVLYPIGFTYSIVLTFIKNGYTELDKYLFNCALATDQHANTYLSKLFNDIMILKGGYKFGNPDETISSVLGKNIETKTLSLIGKGLNNILNLLEDNHATKSIEEL